MALDKKLIKKASKYGVKVTKTVKVFLPFDSMDPYEWYNRFKEFVDTYGTYASAFVEKEYYGYDGGIDEMWISVYVDRDEKEIQKDIKKLELAEKEFKEKKEAKEREEYEKLKKKFEKKESKK